MDLIKCPVCGEKYSSSYRRCPFCEEEDRPVSYTHLDVYKRQERKCGHAAADGEKAGLEKFPEEL